MLKKLLLLMLAPAAVAAQGPARVDPRLRLASRLALHAPAAARAGEPGAPAPFALAGAAPLATGPDGRAWLRTLARIAPGGEAALEAAGARIGTRAGDVVTALVPPDALDRVAAVPALVYLEAAAELRSAIEPLPPARGVGGAGVRAPTSVRNDRGVDDADVAQLRQREGDQLLGLAGQGVVVGIYDSGLDLAHGDFRDGAGTRVLRAWDQTVAGSGPGQVGASSFGYGRDCSRADIGAGACPMRDIVGHGTHLAGTAAGNGAGTGKGMPAWRFAGVAPAADLVIVKGGDGSFTSDRVVDGVSYIFERARELGRPAVVNLSMATQDGPHDGSTNFERALDALLGPGRLLAVAAGNEAVNADESPAFVRAPVHAGGRLGSGARASVDVVIPAYTPAAGASNDGAILEMWYDGRDSLALTVTTPSGRRVRLATGDTTTTSTPEGAIVADNASTGRNPNNGDREAIIALADLEAGSPPASGRWHVEVEGSAVAGSGKWDLWLVGSTITAPGQLTALDGASVRNAVQVASPGSTTRGVTAGAWAGKHAWLTAGGAQQVYPFQERLGDIAFFSNPGPRRDGLLKPEITAPGKVVISSMSRDAGATWKALPAYVEADSTHAVLMGTSMATPFVTGALALLLQLRPTLTPEDVHSILAGSARQDGFTAHPYTGEADATPNAQWGYGKLDVAAAVRRLGPRPGSLRLDVLPVAAPAAGATVASLAGARVDLLRLHLVADSAEAQQVVRLGFDLAGRDTAARLLIVRDDDHDGAAGTAETVVASQPVSLTGLPLHVTMAGPVVPAGTARDYVVTLQLGAGVPNGTRFSAAYRPDDLATRGTLSGEEHRAATAAVVASPGRATSVLEPGETLNLSQNPVLAPPLIINYAQRPRAIFIYSPAGVRVRSISGAQLEDGRALWYLDNDRGSRVAPGIYLLVLDGPSGSTVRKLLVRR